MIPIWLDPDRKDEFGFPVSLSLVETTAESHAARTIMVEAVMTRLFEAAVDQLGADTARTAWRKVAKRKQLGVAAKRKGPKSSRDPERDGRLLAAYDAAVAIGTADQSSLVSCLAKRLHLDDPKMFGPSEKSLAVHIRRIVDRRTARPRPSSSLSSQPSLLELATAKKTE